ncbi:MAG: MOSC domain-containing protein [Planctomycetota bacterium]
MKISSIQIGMPQTYEDVDSKGKKRTWTTAIFKETVEGPVWTTTVGFRGDGQADKRHHGGSDKALNAYCREQYSHWTSELGLDAMPFGAFGENVTIVGALESDVCIGDVFEVGDAVLQISQPRQPCGTLARRWKTPDLVGRVEKHGSTGWYFRVLSEGELMAGDVFKRIERPHPKWTVTLANEVMHHRRTDYVAARELAALPPLAESWKEALERRVAGKE